jgi:hypothetical protein
MIFNNFFHQPTANFEGPVHNHGVLKTCLFVKNLILRSNGVSKSGLWFKIRQPNPEISLLSRCYILTASKIKNWKYQHFSTYSCQKHTLFETSQIFIAFFTDHNLQIIQRYAKAPISRKLATSKVQKWSMQKKIHPIIIGMQYHYSW